MFDFIGKSIIQKISLITIIVFFSIIIIVFVPEGSVLQMFFPFLIGGTMSFFPDKIFSKIDVLFHYFLVMVFFAFWFFILPDKMQSILFLLGALIVNQLKRDLKAFDT